jgi:drug/metabolite transporter (DMT)-like permease
MFTIDKKSHAVRGIFFSVSAAVFSGVYIPLSKLLLNYMPDKLQGGLAYSTSGIVSLFTYFLLLLTKRIPEEQKPKGKDWIAIFLIMAIDCFALFAFYSGFSQTPSNVSSLLASTELLITAFLAFFFLKEKQGWLTWVGIALVTGGTASLSLEGTESSSYSNMWLWVLFAYFCWAAEDVISTKISNRSPFIITGVKCLGSGLFMSILGSIEGQQLQAGWPIAVDILLGIFTVALSISSLILGERNLGAGKATAIFSGSPIVGLILSFVIFRTSPHWSFFLALVLMLSGLACAITDLLKDEKKKKEAATLKANSAKIEEPADTQKKS